MGDDPLYSSGSEYRAGPRTMFPVYDGINRPYDPRILGPHSHHDGVAFWYRADTVEPIYERPSSVYSQAVAPPGSEQVKHRRTRSGCFTCRSRRVKCDEKRPTCERCKKGNRECEYPQPTASKRSKGSDSQSQRGESAESEKKLGSDKTPLTSIKDVDEDNEPSQTASQAPVKSREAHHPAAKVSSRKKRHRQRSEGVVSATKSKAPSPSTDASSAKSRSQTPPSTTQNSTSSSSAAVSLDLTAHRRQWTHLSQDMQKYLQFHHDHLTGYHYFFKQDAQDFLHKDLIELALSYEPLLYAVVAFAAYHLTLREPNGRLSDFLGYYGESISLLRKALVGGRPRSEATIITVLQLATFEEYLGDWINLTGHHRAAHSMLLSLHKPETMMKTERSRQIFAWYARFDVIAGLMAGNETTLGRDWYSTCANYFEAQIDPDDVDVENTLAFSIATNRLIGMDMASLYSRRAKGEITTDVFMMENSTLSQRLAELRMRIQSLNDDFYTVKEFPDRKSPDSDDIVDPYIPGGLYNGAHWPLNFVWIDWYGIKQMHLFQTSVILRLPPPAELEMFSMEQLRIYEAVEKWPGGPEGSVLGAHASLGIATVFLRKEPKYIMWARRKLSNVERMGYMFPAAFRSKMAELWQLPEVNHWWLPNDEGYTPILRDIRTLALDRQGAHTDGKGEDLRDIKSIFSTMNVTESPTRSPTHGGSRQSNKRDAFGSSPTSSTTTENNTSEDRT